jgi:hypothetical protein
MAISLRPFSLLLCFLGAFSLWPTELEALSPEYKERFIARLFEIHAQQPTYKMDHRIKPDAPIEEGVDCSRLVFLAAKRAGIPGVARVCAADMCRGLGGWRGFDLPFGVRDADEADLGFLDTKGRVSHVFAFVVDPGTRLLEIIHASGSAGTTVVEKLPARWGPRVEAVRRLTIGE